MKTTIKYRLLKLAAAMFSLLLISCLKEDMSDCPEEIRVYFVFTTRVSGDQINPADVDRMHLYVFDDKGYYLSEYYDNHITNFNADYYIDCSDLLPGNYRFIAWGGKNELYYSTVPVSFVKGKTSFEEALLMLEYSGGIVSSLLPHLFHSELPATVTTASVQRFDMPLAQVSNTINIRTEGLPADANAYTFNIADNNCIYKFDRSFALPSNAMFTYTAPCTKDEKSQLNASLNVLRLAAGRHIPQLQLYNETTGTLLYPVGTQSGDLIGLILSAYPQNNFDTTHIYDIVFTFEANPDELTGFSVSITINHWKVNDQGNELIE